MTNRINGLRELTPTVADEELANERRRRTDQISRLMGEHLLRGYTMLNEYCARCAVSLSIVFFPDPSGALFGLSPIDKQGSPTRLVQQMW